MRNVAEERPSVKGGHAGGLKGGQASLHAEGSFEELSASALQKYLGGMDYPAGKDDLINHAKKNNAPDSVITALQKFSDQQYQSAADVSKEFGKVK
ncbi:photosystem reaction center subunit H [Methanoculleus taiwanensis]|uniref:Photosystem reaction center subunit H n=1 Tax=Methanoculleus taiwanensis TaxID=1550565 RepID=A0A498H1Y7_9EURY|nr:DUF2795 domain-containing protein [Methanoculleus taiwanensis]RXE56080.1 photosystem reaction center subunit H [Methanoculleus taiwanensis]